MYIIKESPEDLLAIKKNVTKNVGTNFSNSLYGTAGAYRVKFIIFGVPNIIETNHLLLNL